MTARSGLLCCLSIVFCVATFLSPATAQTPETAPPPPSAADRGASASAQPFDADAHRAWSMLTEAAAPGKAAHDRIDALNALGTMGSDAHAGKLIAEAFNAKDVDVRTAAVFAAGQTRNRALLPDLQRALDDDQPQVAYNAALVLWRLRDNSGQDLLIAVAEGDQRPNGSLLKSSKHKAAKDLRSPKKLAELTIANGAGYVLPGAGAGVKAVEYASKSDTPRLRAAALDQLAEEHTDEVHAALIEALTDAEPAVRAAAVKGLARWPGADSAHQIEPLFGDNKTSVRLMAAAAYLRVTQNIHTPEDCRCEEGH